MFLRDFIKTNPFTVIFVCVATVLCGVTFIYSKTVAVAELVVVLGAAIAAVVWFSDSVERKKAYLRRIEGALSQSGESYDRLATFPFPAVLADNGGNILWFNTAFDAVNEDFPDAACTDIREYVGNRFDFAAGSSAPARRAGHHGFRPNRERKTAASAK